MHAILFAPIFTHIQIIDVYDLALVGDLFWTPAMEEMVENKECVIRVYKLLCASGFLFLLSYQVSGDN